MPTRKRFIIIIIGIFSTTYCFSQANQKSKASKPVKTKKEFKLKTLETVTSDNVNNFPELKTNSVEVKYSTSSYYFARLKNDSLTHNR